MIEMKACRVCGRAFDRERWKDGPYICRRCGLKVAAIGLSLGLGCYGVIALIVLFAG